MGEQGEYKELFFSEAREYLQILSDYALQLEKEGNTDLLADMFRAAHSLKGMASTVGFDDIAALTHAMEDLLDELRSGELTMTTETADLFFESVEHLESLISSAELGEEGRLNKGLIERLKASSKKNSNPGAHPRTAMNNGEPSTGIRVSLRPDTPMKAVRAYMVISALDGMGQVLGTQPSMEDLEAEAFGTSFIVYFQSQVDMDEIIARLLAIGDVETAEPLISEEHETKAEGGGEQGNNNLRTTRHVDKFVRVEAHRLDRLMNLVGELVINRTTLVQVSKPLACRELNDALEELGRIIETLQDGVMEMRMIPIKQVFDQFPRMVRNLSHEKGKKIDLVIEGETTELDRSIVNQISDPLVHLIRNSVDHGIETPEERLSAGKDETGRITLAASHESGFIFIRISDDGRGINPDGIRNSAIEKGLITEDEAARLTDNEALDLIFKAGFSTAQEVTDISGRGVGMDVVRSVLESLNGSISIKTKEGLGTTFELRLPLTLAIIKGLLIKVGENLYVVPIESIRENILASVKNIKKVQGNPVILVRNELIPIVSLQKFFGQEEDVGLWKREEVPLMLLESGTKKVAVPVDEFLGQQEIVIKSLGGLLGDTRGVAGATILGDGRVALIIDANSLVHWGDLHVQESTNSR
jgi:two-component system chemotaxis sensor kinase CheA